MSPRWILQSKSRAWAAFCLVVGLLLLGAIGLVRQEIRQSLASAQQSAQRELHLIGSLATEALRRAQYQSLESLLQDWGRSQAQVTELRLIGKNGFVISSYNQGTPPTHALTLSMPIDYSYRGHATLSLTHDLAEVYAANAELRDRLAVLMLVFSGFLGAVMHLLLKRQEEAAVLKSRTQELDAANAALQAENAQRRATEDALFLAKERAEVTLYFIGDAVITTDASGRVDYLNPVADALIGWSMSEAIGRPLSEVFPIFNGGHPEFHQ